VVTAAAASINFTRDGGILFHGPETFATPLIAAATRAKSSTDLTENREIYIPHVQSTSRMGGHCRNFAKMFNVGDFMSLHKFRHSLLCANFVYYLVV